VTLPAYVENLLAKARWRQEINKRGYEGRLPVSSEHLSEALRTELRAILDNDGKPFDLQVARHVYDFAIAAKDLLTVSVKSVEDAMRVVADNNGAMESLTGADDPQPPEQVSETFGARIMRELLATLPAVLRKSNEDLHSLVGAIADARDRGMPDLAAKLEQRLLGTPLESPKITHAEVVHDSYEHGFIEGSMQDNFERGTIDGHAGRGPGTWSPAYREGYEAGQARRQSRESVPALPEGTALSPPVVEPNGHQAGTANHAPAHVVAPDLNEQLRMDTKALRSVADKYIIEEGRVILRETIPASTAKVGVEA
jgi:hypothetical protein